MRTAVFALIVILGPSVRRRFRLAGVRAQDLNAAVADRIQAVMPKVIAWRRDIHEHPELSNREVRTAGVVAAHLKALGLDVQTGVARTGVVGVLKGGRPGRVVALRADMDALPVTEQGDLPVPIDGAIDLRRPGRRASCTPADTMPTSRC